MKRKKDSVVTLHFPLNNGELFLCVMGVLILASSLHILFLSSFNELSIVAGSFGIIGVTFIFHSLVTIRKKKGGT